jgi:hypothetical protein
MTWPTKLTCKATWYRGIISWLVPKLYPIISQWIFSFDLINSNIPLTELEFCKKKVLLSVRSLFCVLESHELWSCLPFPYKLVDKHGDGSRRSWTPSAEFHSACIDTNILATSERPNCPNQHRYLLNNSRSSVAWFSWQFDGYFMGLVFCWWAPYFHWNETLS